MQARRGIPCQTDNSMQNRQLREAKVMTRLENQKHKYHLLSGEYTLETRVRYSECNSDEQAGLSAVLDYMQDTCTFQAEDLSVGVGYMQAHQSAWILNSWQADIMRYPVFGEKIKITTWPYDFNGFFGFRNFKIEDSFGRIIVKASSVWVFMDMHKKRPARIPAEMAEAYQVCPRLDMEYMDRKIPDFEAQPARGEYKIPHYFIDTNQHVNNAKYILMAEELLPSDFKTVRMRAEYRKSAVYGEILYPYFVKQQDFCAVRLDDKDKKPCVLMEFYAKL